MQKEDACHSGIEGHYQDLSRRRRKRGGYARDRSALRATGLCTGLDNKIETTAANVHDTAPVPELLEGTEEEVFGDSGYLGVDQHEGVPKVNREGNPIQFRINVRRSSLKKLPEAEQAKAREAEHAKSSIRCKVEHVFAVVKGMLRYRKTRLRGLSKVDAQLHMLFALANLILADRPSVTA